MTLPIIYRPSFECAFDSKFYIGGIGPVLWETTKEQKQLIPELNIAILLPLHNRREYLTENYSLKEETELSFSYTIPLQFVPDEWKGFDPIEYVDIQTRVYSMIHQGIRFYFFSNQFENAYEDNIYPVWDATDNNILFFKQPVFQYDCYHFLCRMNQSQPIIVHIEDTNNGYLLCALLKEFSNIATITSLHDCRLWENSVIINMVTTILQKHSIHPQLHRLSDMSTLPAYMEFNNRSGSIATRDFMYNNYIPPHYFLYQYSDMLTVDSTGHADFVTTYRNSVFESYFQKQFSHIISPLLSFNRIRTVPLGIAREWKYLSDTFMHEEKQNDSIVFFHNARWDPYHKGQEELIAAFAVLLKKYSNIRIILSMVLKMPYTYSPLETLCKEYPSQVIFTGEYLSKKEMAKYLAQADFVIAPSKNHLESFNLSVGEAMLFGCVPILSDQLQMRHWISLFENREELLLPSVSDAGCNDQLVEAIVACVSRIHDTFSQNKIRYLQQKSRDIAKEYTFTKTASLYIELYDYIMKKHL